MTLFRYRTNTLKLNWRQVPVRDVDCSLCEAGAEETLRHFLKECRGLGGIREIHGVREEDEIKELLLFCNWDKKKIRERKKYLEDLWRERTQHLRWSGKV